MSQHLVGRGRLASEVGDADTDRGQVENRLTVPSSGRRSGWVGHVYRQRRDATCAVHEFPFPWVSQTNQKAHPPTLVLLSYTHLRAHETVLDLVCRLLLEK